MTRRRGQDELTQRRRLNSGCCPVHGIPLLQDVPYFMANGFAGAKFYCPRRDCDFSRHYDEDSTVWKAVESGGR